MTKNKNYELTKRMAGEPIYLKMDRFFAIYIQCAAEPVVPGQPIKITWNFRALVSSGFYPGKVTARIYLDFFNALLYQSPAISLVTTKYFDETSDQKIQVAPPANGGVANQLYHIGTNTLRIDISYDKTGELFSEWFDLKVKPDSVCNWVWEKPIGTVNSLPSTQLPLGLQFLHSYYDFVINHSFNLSGRIENLVTNTNLWISGSVSLIEKLSGTNDIIELESNLFLVGPGANFAIAFNEIKKNWTWLISGIWVYNFSESREKTYNYEIKFSYSDSYGNTYNDILSPWTMSITISVSDEKKAYASAALAALGISLIAAIFTFGGAASAAQSIANGLGNKALDPPEPDSRFKNRIALDSKIKKIVAITDNRFQYIIEFLNLVNKALEIFDVMGDIQNRYLGALLAKDKKSIIMQKSSYKEARKILTNIVRKISISSKKSVYNLSRYPEFQSYEIEKRLRNWQRQGPDIEDKKKLIENGCSENLILLLIRLSNEESAFQLIRSIEQTISLLTFSILQINTKLKFIIK